MKGHRKVSSIRRTKLNRLVQRLNICGFNNARASFYDTSILPVRMVMMFVWLITKI